MTARRSHLETVVHADPAEADHLRGLRDQFDAAFKGPHAPYLIAPDGARVELPASVVDALQVVLDALSRGQTITIVPRDRELTSQEAADVLNVSRPHLIKLLGEGAVPFHRVGTHRRIKIEDVLAYRERRDAERDAALAELTRLSEELPGGYQ